MPIFEFSCDNCGEVIEEITNDRELKEIRCECGAMSKKIMSTAVWDIKGGGVYRHNPPDRMEEKPPKQGHRRITTIKQSSINTNKEKM